MTISKMTNTLDGIGNRLDIAKAMISELAGIAIVTIQNETEKIFLSKNSISKLWNNFKRHTIQIIGGSESSEEPGTENIKK